MTRVPSLVLVAFYALCIGGCSAPSARLTFPRSPIRQDDKTTWYDVNHDGKPDFAISLDADGRADTLSYDDDEDGQIDRVYHLSDYANADVPHLILLLDSIPFQCIEDRYRAGDFRWFDPPQKVIAPFPTLTEVCYTDLLHAPPLPGVIDQYYDPRLKKTRNVVWDRINGYEEPWEKRLAYHAKFWEGGLAYLDPRPWCAAEMRRVYDTFEHSPNRVTIVYVTSASGMMCKYGRQGFDEIMDEVRQLTLQLLYERHGAIKISVMADHGHNLVESHNIHLDDTLRAAGFRPAKRLDDPRDVVLEMNGLVTYAGIHTTQPAEVSDALLTLHEIELAMYMQGNRVIVRDAQGAAAVECHGRTFRYTPIDRDVLGLSPTIDSLKARNKISADGFVSADDWFAATVDHPWPDAPPRIWAAFHERAVNIPDVMLSVRDGYCIGLPAYEKYIHMASTHGGLNQINSATFLMTMNGSATHPLRTGEVLETIEPNHLPVSAICPSR